MIEQDYNINPREVVRRRLLEDLRKVEAIDVRTAILCGELGCGEIVQDFVSRHQSLRCPYIGRVDDPKAYCERLRREYRAAIEAEQGEDAGTNPSF